MPAKRKSKADALAELAQVRGIEPGFRDARGEDKRTAPETQRRLLAAMGLQPTTEEEIQALLAREEQTDAVALPSVIVAPLKKNRCVVELPSSVQGESLEWHLVLEDGSQRSGTSVVKRARPAGKGAAPQPRIELGDVPFGYHRLHLPSLDVSTTLIVTPGACWLPEGFSEGAGLWGLSVQLYLLRSDQNWGIGDFADLRELVVAVARHGCQVIGLNPLHQMFLDDPEHASPYSPLTRLGLNALFISVPEAPGYEESTDLQDWMATAEFRNQLAACRACPNVDYAGVAGLKLQALRLLFQDFSGRPKAERDGFEVFRREHGETLRLNSIFQTLRQNFAAADPPSPDWHTWPEEFRDARSSAVARFADEHRDEIEFLDWLQWVADEQLARAAQAAREAGMAIGVYRDLAVGCDHAGAETWTRPHAFLSGVQVGAPPDIFNPAGQNWGLPPFDPRSLREEAYSSFVELIRANMRHAGGLRIDHVMGLQHLYCIPEGMNAAEGAYVRYTLDDLVGVLALESHRQGCLVVGEDLGTVPEGFRERLAAANILSYRVLFFEQDWDDGTFLPPSMYPKLSLAVAGSHDLPTLVGWWEGSDIDLKESLGLYPSSDEAGRQREQRARERAALLEAVQKANLVCGDMDAEKFLVAAHEFLARTTSGLVAPQLDDLLAEPDQVNVPATSTEHPNWRRKYRLTLEELARSEKVWRRAGSIAESRGRRKPEVRRPA
ncbi:MAG TPA: 4-alpha-glucanotransferase [Mesorhizobium sp.]|jgi:4-alpha-glucanotransferase|nr:4-alpha-glucanotransferase [Mesorhizobium sp.]